MAAASIHLAPRLVDVASVCTITGEVAFSCVACLVVRRARLKVREDSDVCTACLIAWKTLMTEITSTLSTAVDHPNVVVQLRHSPLAETMRIRQQMDRIHSLFVAEVSVGTYSRESLPYSVLSRATDGPVCEIRAARPAQREC